MAPSAPAVVLAEAAAVSTQMRPALVRYFKRKCNDVTEAEDLAQDVLVRTLAQTAGKSLEQAKGYVFRAAVNRWNDRYRRTQVRGVTLEWNDAVVAAVPEARTPEREVLGRQELHQVCSALMELSERTRDVFVRRRHGEWSAREESEHEARLTADPGYAAAVRSVGESWQALEPHVISPEMLAMREQALGRARRSNASRGLASGRARWRRAAAVAAIAALAIAYQLSPLGFRTGVHETGVGELRILRLDDRSRIALDADTRVRVRFTEEARSVELLKGQAQFSVVADPGRPFRVLAGGRVIVALGTVFNVEYSGAEVRVVTLEGRVAVVPAQRDSQGSPAPVHVAPASSAKVPARIELGAGEAAQVSPQGEVQPVPPGERAAASAWPEGKLILRDTPLRQAVQRLNRHSRQKLEIGDPALEDMHISGVFVAGDNWAFAEAALISLPVRVERLGDHAIRLEPR